MKREVLIIALLIAVAVFVWVFAVKSFKQPESTTTQLNQQENLVTDTTQFNDGQILDDSGEKIKFEDFKDVAGIIFGN